MGQIIIIYLAKNSSRNSENHVWTLQFVHILCHLHSFMHIFYALCC